MGWSVFDLNTKIEVYKEMKTKILYTKPSMTKKEFGYVEDAIKNGWGENCYDYIYKFENRFKKYLSVKYSVATSSCTGAMQLGLHALGIRENDEVILSDTNWIATVSPIVHLKAKPIFVDILEDTWCIDPKQIEKKINKKTKAIIITHLYGNVCKIDEILSLSKKYNIPIIEDAAESLGSVYKGKLTGSFGKFSVFSFHGTKTISSGEGGMFVSNDKKLYEKVLELNNHGRSINEKRQFWANEIGYKFKISNIQAAIGCAQIERIDELVKRKQEIFHYYLNHLSIYNELKLNPIIKGIENCFWMPTVVFNKKSKIDRETLVKAFKRENIDARVFFWPLSGLNMFKDDKNNFNAWDICKRAINLPSYHDMTYGDQDRVINVIKNMIKD